MSLKLEHHGGGGRKKKVFGIIPRATSLLLLFYTSSRSFFRGGGGGGGGSCRSVSASRIEQREGSINITPSSSFPRFSSFFPLSPPCAAVDKWSRDEKWARNGRRRKRGKGRSVYEGRKERGEGKFPESSEGGGGGENLPRMVGSGAKYFSGASSSSSRLVGD